jgi:hypothetical protein
MYVSLAFVLILSSKSSVFCTQTMDVPRNKSLVTTKKTSQRWSGTHANFPWYLWPLANTVPSIPILLTNIKSQIRQYTSHNDTKVREWGSNGCWVQKGFSEGMSRELIQSPGKKFYKPQVQSCSGRRVVQHSFGWPAVLTVSLKQVVCHRQEKLYLSWSLGTEVEILHCGDFPWQRLWWVTKW